MGSFRDVITSKAAEFGADDLAFAGCDKDKNLCVIVLFFRYYAPIAPAEGSINLSPYYIASNRGYNAAKRLTAYIKEQGFFAQHDTHIDVKCEALKTGGFIGRNGFYYHPDLGSLVSIQTVITDAVLPDQRKDSIKACLHCGACIAACPFGAVGDLKNCLRNHSNSVIPEHLRHGLYQLLGCELCQTACPLNSKEQRCVPQFKTKELLLGQHLKELQELIGKNMARKQRIISQAAIYAANTAQKNTIEQLKLLCDTAQSWAKEHAVWALNKLEGKE